MSDPAASSWSWSANSDKGSAGEMRASAGGERVLPSPLLVTEGGMDPWETESGREEVGD